jgi:hypothetical protein
VSIGIAVPASALAPARIERPVGKAKRLIDRRLNA